jgi:hypothetical protein
VKNSTKTKIIGLLAVASIVGQILGDPPGNCDYTDNSITPGGPHCHDIAELTGSGWTYWGVCGYYYCDSTVPCNGKWTMKQRLKIVKYKVVNGVTEYRTDNVSDLVEGCCHCMTNYVERPL